MSFLSLRTVRTLLKESRKKRHPSNSRYLCNTYAWDPGPREPGSWYVWGLRLLKYDEKRSLETIVLGRRGAIRRSEASQRLRDHEYNYGVDLSFVYLGMYLNIEKQEIFSVCLAY
jgi:hypothetical protein